MNVQVALENIYLKPSSRWGHTKYSMDYHRNYLAKKTDLPVDASELIRQAYDVLQVGFHLAYQRRDN